VGPSMCDFIAGKHNIYAVNIAMTVKFFIPDYCAIAVSDAGYTHKIILPIQFFLNDSQFFELHKNLGCLYFYLIRHLCFMR
jgi:hypothetical protein